MLVVAAGENPQPFVLRDSLDHTHLLNSVPLPFIMLQVSLMHMERELQRLIPAHVCGPCLPVGEEFDLF